MKKLLIALTALSIAAASSAFAGDAKTTCKKCSGEDKNAACSCKCDKEKGCSEKK